MKIISKYNILILFMLLISSYIVFQLAKISADKRSRLKMINSIPNDYKNLFNQKDNNITNFESYILYNTDFSPISDFYYNDKLWVIVTKLKISMNNIDSIPNIHLKYGKSALSEGKVYAGFDEGYFHVDILPESNIIKTIDLMIDGNLLSNNKKDRNIAIYNFNLGAISIGYDGLKQNDINIKTSAKASVSSIVLFKQKQILYFIFISQADPKKTGESLELKKILGHIIQSEE